jgi:TRAP-type C4-dicarboxylate transport system substrate-binding protein
MKRRAFMLAALATTVAAQAEVKWDLPTGYGVSTFHTQNVQQYADDVARATGGKLKITLHPGGSLFKANEIKRAVQTGQVQAGEFILSGAANEHPLFGVDSIPFLATGYDEAKRLADASRAPLEKLLSTQGMKLLFTVPWPAQSLYSSKPVTALSDLRGTKMRAYNPATSRIAQLVSAQPVTIQLAELPQALATGTVENFITSSASGVESKLYEQVKYFYDVSAWLPKNAVVVHRQSFEALDKPTQEAVIKAAAEAQARGWSLSQQKDKEYLAELAAKGMQVSTTNARLKQELKVVGERMTGEWLGVAGPDGQAIIDAYRRH